jgi:hypothetical protein
MFEIYVFPRENMDLEVLRVIVSSLETMFIFDDVVFQFIVKQFGEFKI